MKITIIENGYLDDGINNVVYENRKNNSDVYDLVYAYNDIGNKLEKGFIGEATYEKVFIYETFIKIHATFQTSIKLAEMGAYEDSSCLLRNMYDKFFDICFVIKDAENLKYLNNNFVKEMLSLLKYLENNKLFDIVPKDKLDKLICQFAKTQNKNVKRVYNGVEKAKEVGMQREYAHYKLLSTFVHNGLDKIFENIIIKNNGIILNSGFRIDNIRSTLLLIIGLFDDVLNHICNFLNKKDLIKELQQLEEQYKSIAENNIIKK